MIHIVRSAIKAAGSTRKLARILERSDGYQSVFYRWKQVPIDCVMPIARLMDLPPTAVRPDFDEFRRRLNTP